MGMLTQLVCSARPYRFCKLGVALLNLGEFFVCVDAVLRAGRRELPTIEHTRNDGSIIKCTLMVFANLI